MSKIISYDNFPSPASSDCDRIICMSERKYSVCQDKIMPPAKEIRTEVQLFELLEIN